MERYLFMLKDMIKQLCKACAKFVFHIFLSLHPSTILYEN
jgi:hypothetical protein